MIKAMTFGILQSLNTYLLVVSILWKFTDGNITNEATKRYCEAANKLSSIMQLIKKRKKHSESLLLFDGCTDWWTTVDMKCHLAFPAEIMLAVQVKLNAQCSNLVIWLVISKRVYIIELMVPFAGKYWHSISIQTEKYEGSYLRNSLTTNTLWMPRFYCQFDLCITK